MRIALVTAGLLVLAVSGGCSRAYYRQRADREANGVIAEKSRDPRWPVQDFRIEPDPRSRFAEPHCPDHPPMPPDDPAANALAPKPQKPDEMLLHPNEGTG